MAKKVQAAKPNTSKSETVKVVDSYLDMFFMRQMPVSEAFLERLASEWIEWAKLPTSFRLNQFYNERGIPNKMMYRWAKKCSKLQEAHDMVLSMLADRRDIGALTKELDGAQVRETFALYDPEFKEFMKWKAQISKEEDKGKGNITVVFENFPSSEDVPTRKKIE